MTVVVEVEETTTAIDAPPANNVPDTAEVQACEQVKPECRTKRSGVMGNVGQDDRDSMFHLDLAFAATALVALIAIAWWTAESPARATVAREPGDWALMSSAACAAMVTIAMAGVAYFGARLLRAGASEHPLWDMPWQARAAAWCGLVGVGVLVMWVGAFAGFWQSVGDIDHARGPVRNAGRRSSTDMWRLWMSILAVGVLPALGLIIEGRFPLLLGMLLVLVFAVFAGGAVLVAGREEVASPRPATV